MTKELKYFPDKSKLSEIIFVDEDESTVSTLNTLLRREGYKTTFFTSVSEALQFLEHNNVDVLLSAFQMQKMNGIEFLTGAMDICPDSIRIIISGHEEKQQILEAVSKGIINHYVVKPWNDDQIKSLIKDSVKFQRELKKKQLLEVLHSFKNIPSPPKLHSRLKSILFDEQQHQRKIAGEIEKSPALVAKLITVSNSVYYCVRRPVTNVLEALSFIGTEAVLNIILGLEAFDNICVNALPESIEILENIRNRSVNRAQIAREISLLWGMNVDPQEAYISALMLDIGLMMRFCCSQEKFHKFLIEHQHMKDPIFVTDKEIYSVTHDEVGAAILIHWNFPQSIIDTVANHHRYANDDALTIVVQIADSIICGNDSLPHDPRVDEFAIEWREKLHHIFNTELK